MGSFKSYFKKAFIVFLVLSFIATSFLAFDFGNAATKLNNTEKVFRALDNWPKPPLYQGNVFASGGVGYYGERFMFEGLFLIVRSTDQIFNRLAQSYEHKGNKTIVHLRKNVKWHDGQKFTSKDVWAYYILNNGVEVARRLDSIETPDDYTVVFNWHEPAPFPELRIIFLAQDRQGTIPYHIYKKYVDNAAKILSSAKKTNDPAKRGPFGYEITDSIRKQLDNNWQQFLKYNPKKPIGTGPFKFYAVSDTQLVLVKNRDYWDAKNVTFEKVVFYQVNDLSSQYAMLRAGKLENFNYTQPKDVLESILRANKDLVHYKMFDPACAGLLLNVRKYPFNNVKFRQALVYALDRTKIREFANYYATEYKKYSSLGIAQSELNKWVSVDTQKKMTDYSYNPKKAEQLLREIGWRKGADGIWVDPNGKKYEFYIGVAAGWEAVINYSQAVAEQLTAFGLPTKVKIVEGSTYWQKVQEGAYDIGTDWVDITWYSSDPYFYLSQTFGWIATINGLPRDPKTGKLTLKLKGPDGKEIDVAKILDEYPYTYDLKKRMKMVNDLVYAINENAFNIALYQNTTGVWINTKTFGGKLPMADQFAKYNRNMPLPTNKEDKRRIAILNLGFGGYMSLVNGEYQPK